MHILFLSHYFPPEGNAPASRTYENCKRWVRRGHQVTVITCAPNCPNGVVYKGYKNKIRQKEQLDGIDVIRVWSFIAANQGTFRRTCNYLSYMLSAIFFALFVSKPHVLIATSPQFFCGCAGVIVSKIRRLPFILEIRDIWPESIAAVGAVEHEKALSLLERLERWMYAAADHIVTVGEGYKDRLRERGVPDNKLSVIMNGVDKEVFYPREPDHALRKQLGLEGKFVCSYIGTIGMACALDVVLRAAALLKRENRHEIAFLLVGDGATRIFLEAEAKKQGLDNVIFTGRIDKKEIPAFFSISDVCLVHLRKTELFESVMPSKIFEAAGMAKPIINGVSGFAADFVNRAGAGICVEPENENAIVEALLYLAGNPQAKLAMGRRGYDNVASNFNRDAQSEAYLRIIQEHAVSRGDR